MDTILIRALIYFALICLAFLSGFIKGCNHASADYKRAESKYITVTKHIKDVEKVEVVKWKERIQWLDHTETKLVEAANAEPNKDVSCDFSSDRVWRINQAASITSQ